MLYDILPPFAFFTSLGGIILVVSRVVIRLRRQAYTSDVEAAVAQARAEASPTTDLARIVGPSKKSVHIIKNRLALMGVSSRAAATSLKQSLARSRGALIQRDPKTTLAKPFRALGAKTSGLASRLRDRRARRASRRKKAAQQPALSLAKTSQDTTPRLSIRQEVENTTDHPAAKKPRLRSKKRRRLTALQQAQAAITQGQTGKAEDLLVPHLASHPRDTRAYLLLGQVACLRHDWSEALEIFEQVVKLDPDTKDGYAALGLAAFEAGKFTKAIEALQRAHTHDPTNAQVLRCLLTIAQRMDNTPMQRQFQSELKSLSKKTAKQTAKRHKHPVR